MRHDMSKIITEPARLGVGYYRTLPNHYRRAKNFKLDEDLNVNDEFTARVLPMRGKTVGWDGKSFHFNYNVINRFLKSCIGSVWNDVYAEISNACKTRAAKALDLHRLFINEVETNTYVGDDGRVYFTTTQYWNGDRCIEDVYNTLYVDPRDGILRLSIGESYENIRKKRRKAAIAEAATTYREIDGLKFKKINDVWFLITKKKVETINGRGRTRAEEVIDSRQTVSKFDIRRYKLN